MNKMQMLSQFPQFMNQMRGQDPKQILDNLVQSGRVSQEQVEQAKKTAEQMYSQFNQFKGMFNFMK